MDDLTAVRELTDDVPELTDGARAAARVRLQRAIIQEGRPRALSRRLMLGAAVAGAGAAAVAGGVVLATDSDRPRMAALSAAEVLQTAAVRSRAAGSGLPVPRDDQYFYTRTFITRTYDKGGRPRTWTDESWMSVDGSKPSLREEYGKIHHDPPLDEHEVQWPPTQYAKLAKWPTDPDELLKLLRFRRGSSAKADGEAFLNACLLMKGPRVMPPGLEAAAFDAVARIPRIVLDRHEEDALGRRGIGVSYPGTTFSFVFDARSYAYLGLRLRGSTAKLVDGRFRYSHWYSEMSSLRDLAVVDRIGRLP